MKPIIKVEGLSKRYRIGARQDPYGSFRESLARAVKAPFKRLNDQRDRSDGTIWALRDVSFEVYPGDVVGIIGRNGAGKSTLLKILSRITEPTEGGVDLYGRVASLLEVGTGFHPELTGRENIFLNGAILGMKQSEIQRRFDEIVAFAEVEQFIDTPVKHYSSGMYLRLAFAVAAHLEPEILLVDEVLAVGDAAFQSKCIGKMGEVSNQGRTILFVSHNLAAVQALCHRGIFLQNGTIESDYTVTESIATYLRSIEEAGIKSLIDRRDRRGKGDVRLSAVTWTTEEGRAGDALRTGSSALFVFHLTGLLPNLSCVFTIYDYMGQPIANLNSNLHAPGDLRDPAVGATLRCFIEELPLVPGRYRMNVAISSNNELQDHIEGAAFFDVSQGALQGRPIAKDSGFGKVCLKHRWILPSA